MAGAMTPTLTERAGTWEILFQNVNGRYVQVQLTLLGTGRATPEIRSLRLWYPRFSYRDHYLPAIYGEEPVSAGLTERLLANFEGFYTTLEDRIVQLPSLLDPRTAPTEALDWLADWLGVVLHPLWEEERRRFFIRFAHRLYQIRGTLPGIIIALRIFLDETVDDSLFDPECLLRSNIRIVEHFLTRDVAGSVFGDPQEMRPRRRLSLRQRTASRSCCRTGCRRTRPFGDALPARRCAWRSASSSWRSRPTPGSTSRSIGTCSASARPGSAWTRRSATRPFSSPWSWAMPFCPMPRSAVPIPWTSRTAL